MKTMVQLQSILVLSILSLLHSCSRAQEQRYNTTIIPSDLDAENATLEIPVGGSIKLTFELRYKSDGPRYEALASGGDSVREIHEDSSTVESGEISFVRRSCADSDRPNVDCKSVQITVNGLEKSTVNGWLLRFGVRNELSVTDYIYFITLKIVEELPATATTEEIVDRAIDQRQDRHELFSEPEIIIPWVLVAILSALLILTIATLILVICKYRKRQGKSDCRMDQERGETINFDRICDQMSNTSESTTRLSCEDTHSMSKDSIAETTLNS